VVDGIEGLLQSRMLSSPLPSSCITRAQYLREHLNAPPSKLRDFIKNTIFVNDDVDYLKRLVKDIGGMDYVFRFLWYDGPVPTASSSGAAAEPADTTGETSDCNNNETNMRVGRTWIQYCCYWNAHQCLKWIFQEIIRDYLHKKRQNQRQSTTSINSSIAEDEEDGIKSNESSEEEQLLSVIQQLLKFPSASYCGTNYVAVATLRNSYQCLSLLLEYGGIDPNMPINAHRSTAAHLAAFTNHVECLSVLESGSYACHFVTGDDDDDDDEGGTSTDKSQSQATNNESEIFDNLLLGEPPELSREAYFAGMVSAPLGKKGAWKADWNRINGQGDTVLHIAAREGHKEAMQFFLNAITESAMNKESDENHIIDFSIRNTFGMDCIAVAAMNNHAEIITMVSDSIEYLTKDVFHVDGNEADRDTFRMPQSPMHMKQPHIQPIPNRRRVQSEPYNYVATFLPSSAKQAVLAQPLHRASKNTLPSHFPSLNNRNSLEKYDHQMPLHVAAQFGNCETIEALFESDYCEATARDSMGRTALHVAASENHLDACRMLVYLAEDIFEEFDVVDVLGRTPLYIACLHGNVPLARILISVSNWRVLCHERKKATVGPLYVNVAHQPPFHAAVVNNHLETARVLLDNGVDVNQTDLDGRTAISAAAKLGLYDMCQMLISYGADVNRRSSRGGPTPFQKAKKYKHFDVANLLFEFGGQ
jgi:ankyrin repeat protein